MTRPRLYGAVLAITAMVFLGVPAARAQETDTSMRRGRLQRTGLTPSATQDRSTNIAGVQPTTGTHASTSIVALTLADAIVRAMANSPQFQAALVQLGIAREDHVQARAALLPNVDYNNGYIYTQGNGTLSGRFIANNGVHEYISQGAVTQNLGLAQVADYRRTAAAQALARAKAEIAARGLTVTIVQAYYGLQSAEAKAADTRAAAD